MSSQHSWKFHSAWIVAGLFCLAVVSAIGTVGFRIYFEDWKPYVDREAAIAKIPDSRIKEFATRATKFALTRSPIGLDLASGGSDYFRSDVLIRLNSEVEASLPSLRIKNIHMTPQVDLVNILTQNSIHYVGVTGTCHIVGNYEGTPIEETRSFRVLLSVVPDVGPVDPETCKLRVADYKIHLDSGSDLVNPTATPTGGVETSENVPDEVKQFGKKGVQIAMTQSSTGIFDLDTARTMFDPEVITRMQSMFQSHFPNVQNLKTLATIDSEHSIISDGIYYYGESGTCSVTGTKDGKDFQQQDEFRILFSIIKNPKLGGERYLIKDYKLGLSTKPS